MSAAPVSTRQDDRLLSEAYEGDVRAFEELFNRHYPRVYGVVVRIVGVQEDAEELTLDVFLSLYKQRLVIDDQINVAGWLYRSATNAAFNALRARKRRFGMFDRIKRFERQSTAIGVDPLEVVERDETAAQVRENLAQLPERQRNALVLKAAGLKYREIAEVIEVKPSSVGQILARAERSLKKQLKDGGAT